MENGEVLEGTLFDQLAAIRSLHNNKQFVWGLRESVCVTLIQFIRPSNFSGRFTMSVFQKHNVPQNRNTINQPEISLICNYNSIFFTKYNT